MTSNYCTSVTTALFHVYIFHWHVPYANVLIPLLLRIFHTFKCNFTIVLMCVTLAFSVLRRRMQEAEQKQAQLHRKTHCFQSLIDASRPNKIARVDSPSPSVSPVSVSITTTSNSAVPVTLPTNSSASSSITVVTRRDTETGKPTVIIPTRSSRKSSKYSSDRISRIVLI